MPRTHLQRLTVLSTLGLVLAGCGDDKSAESATTTTGSGITNVTTPGSSTGIDPTNPTSGEMKFDLPEDDSSASGCGTDSACNWLDVLFVIDNSGTMGEEQVNLAKNFPYLIEKLRNVTDEDGNPVNANVNIMVTTTDFGHPLCTQFEKPDYDPAKGAPISTACINRLERFTGLGSNPPKFEIACTQGCSTPVEPTDPFINFGPNFSNVVGADPNGDPAAQALACIGPQGIDGCGMEAPLETMLQALDPNKPWNQGPRPFLRKGAVLAIVIMTDEAECSVKDYKYFDPKLKDDPEYNKYFEDVPGMPGVKNEPTSAVCFNAGVTCVDNNQDGIYESCMSEDKGVLQPLSRYINYLKGVLVEKEHKEVIMLGILGVPKVTEHNDKPPYEPIAGGVYDLVYRKWTQTDILPGDPDTPEQKEYEFGIGPGCTDPATGQAIPNTRVIEVCQSLDVPDDPNTPYNEKKVRCCIESICDDDFSDAINCLAGILRETLEVPG
ncbi:MAG TPA: vWA domain-containing protein [Nannocystis sp.]